MFDDSNEFRWDNTHVLELLAKLNLFIRINPIVEIVII